MKLLDRYIIKQFLLTALFGIVAFTIIFIVIDLMEKLDDFLDRKAEVMVIVEYYLAFTPEMIKLMTPVAILLSSLFTTGKLSNNNELTAMKSSGVSLYRFMLPMMIIALVISVLSVYFNGWIVPYANQQKFKIERIYVQRNYETTARSNIYLQDGPRRIVYMSYFDRATSMGSHASIQDFSDSNLISIARRVDAQQIQWDSTSGKWTMINATIRVFENQREEVRRVDRLTMDTLHFVPIDIVKKEDKPDEMNYFELQRFIKRQQQTGNDVARWQVDFYSKVSFPFASFIVVLFGVPFSFGKRRGGLAVQFGIAVAVCFIYLIFMKTSQVFGYNGDLHPLLTAWLANLIFLAGGVANIFRVEK
jgi:lipopolysaccharide export system permease protein